MPRTLPPLPSYPKRLNTPDQYDALLASCRTLFLAKTHDYGTAWRILRLPSVTDQIFIKANRIRTIQETGVQLVADDVNEEFVAIINYCLIALMQLHLPKDTPLDMPPAGRSRSLRPRSRRKPPPAAGQKPRLRRSLAPDARGQHHRPDTDEAAPREAARRHWRGRAGERKCGRQLPRHAELRGICADFAGRGEEAQP